MKEVGEDEVEKCKNDALNSAAKYVANQLQVSYICSNASLLVGVVFRELIFK